MWPDRAWDPKPLALESDVLLNVLRSLAQVIISLPSARGRQNNESYKFLLLCYIACFASSLTFHLLPIWQCCLEQVGY